MVLALVSSVIMLLSVALHLTAGQQGAINAVAAALVGLITSISVAKDGGLALIVGLIKAAVALGIAFGLNWTPEVQAMVMTVATTVVQLFVRTQVTAKVPAT